MTVGYGTGRFEARGVRGAGTASGGDPDPPRRPHRSTDSEFVGPSRLHSELCPLGESRTRWYLCQKHTAGIVFQAGNGRLDSVANSCPVCGGLSGPFLGCACEYAAAPLDRSARPGRTIRRRTAPVSSS